MKFDKERIIDEYMRALHGCFCLDMTPSHYTKTGAMMAGKTYGRAEGIGMGINIMLNIMGMKFEYDDDYNIVDIVEIG